MRFLKSLVLFAAVMLGAVTSSFGANADITVTVTPIPTAVSVSRQCTATGCTLTNYAAWKLEVQNNTTNVINQFVLTSDGTYTDVTGATPDQTSTFVESIPSGLCTSPVTPADNTINCNVGQLRGSTTFVVIFRSPPITDTIGYATTSTIDFHYKGTFSKAASPTTPTTDGGQFSGTSTTSLITTELAPIRRNLKTYVPSFGGTFFTGSNGTAFDYDLSATKLRIQSLLSLTTAEVVEDDGVPGGTTNVTITTNTTQIRIPAPKNAQGVSQLFASPITIELRRDASTIRSFNQIDRAVLYYQSESGEPVTVLPDTQLQNCSDVGGPNANNPVCISGRVAVSKKVLQQSPPPFGLTLTADDEGDWIFILLALQNGSIKW